MLCRREVLKKAVQFGAVVAWPLPSLSLGQSEPDGVEVNDMQSQLNRTRVNRIARPTTHDEIEAVLTSARREGRGVSIAGGRHSMGGQQFGRDTILIDMKQFNRVVNLDLDRGLIEVQAGIEWPQLIDHLHQAQAGRTQPWTVRQKQTGVDRVSIGGALASNIHGRGLRFAPIVGDVESFVVVDAEGKRHHCSRRENSELFALAIGGYGLFGVITNVTLRLMPRMKMERLVDIIAVKDLLERTDARILEGCIYGDCQYSTDLQTDAGSHAGVFSCYRPVPLDWPMPDQQKHLTSDDWAQLYTLARTNKKKAFERYSTYYAATSGQLYWSDALQLAGSFQDYAKAVEPGRGTEMITEIYVSRENFVPLLAKSRQDCFEHDVDMTYGTIRFIETDADTFLAWAREPRVCIVCNLHVVHTAEGIQKATADFRRIIDRAIEFGGSYFLTYHRWATRQQVEACYPQFVDFLRLKRKYDPQERFQSDWYRHYRDVFADRL